MKLNNRGWGLRSMIIILCGLFIALGVATYYIHVLYGIYDNNAKKIQEEKEKNSSSKNKVNTSDNTTNNSSNTTNENDEDKKVTTNYTVLEKKLSTSALNYLNDIEENIAEDFTLTLTFNELQTNNYIDNLIEEEGKSTCDGYVIVYVSDGYLISDPYITCSKYQTENFESWRLN